MSHGDCLFCKIIEKKIPAEIIYEDEKVIGFRDLYPQAKLHYLFINLVHSKNVNEIAPNGTQIQEIFEGIKNFTETEQLDSSGFRVVTNVGPHAGQTVFHTHFHVLGGEKLGTFGR